MSARLGSRGLATVALSTGGLLASACATPPAVDPLDSPPPPLADALAELEAGPPCAGDWHPVGAGDRPLVYEVERCAPVYPAVLSAAGIIGSCRVEFRLADTGRPTDVASRCDVDGAYGPYAEAWSLFAASLFEASANRSIAAYRMSGPQAKYVQPVRFMLDDDPGSVPVPGGIEPEVADAS